MKRTSIAAYPAIAAAGARPRVARGFGWWAMAGAALSLAVDTKHVNQPARRLSRQPT